LFGHRELRIREFRRSDRRDDSPRHNGISSVQNVASAQESAPEKVASKKNADAAEGISFFDQFQGGAQQRFFQVAVVIAARATASVMSRPAHVNSFYMSCRVSSREFYAGTSLLSTGKTS